LTIVYLVLLIIALLLSGFGWSKKLKKINAPLSWFFIYTFSILIGFRSQYSGVDTKEYYKYFNDISDRITPYFTFEPGFTFFTLFMTEITTVEVYIFVLSFIQLLFIYLSAKVLKITNGLLTVVVYLSFIPGFDMLTNGIRGGMTLSISLLFLSLTVISKNKLAVLNFIPSVMHASTVIVAVASIFTKKFAHVKINTLIFSLNLTFFILWLFINPLSLLDVFSKTSKEVGYLGTLIRYLIIEKELMSFSVKLYFICLSILFSLLYFLTLKYNKESRTDDILTRLAFIGLSTQFIYALFSFSQYSYRFMFLAYPLQLLMFCYIMDKYYSGVHRNLIIFSICFLGLITTYSTKTFSSFKLLSL